SDVADASQSQPWRRRGLPAVAASEAKVEEADEEMMTARPSSDKLVGCDAVGGMGRCRIF
ncbi:unnamed protein product, partial [Urochloa humidicola]